MNNGIWYDFKESEPDRLSACVELDPGENYYALSLIMLSNHSNLVPLWEVSESYVSPLVSCRYGPS